jgi:TM2 domain-containing membrane protein YozV
MALISCRECGKKISDQSQSCIGCGHPLNPLVFDSRRGNTYHQKPMKSKGAAAFLALFLGGIGAHKFYLEQPFMGLIYLCFCWTLVPAIIGVLESLVYIFMSHKEFMARHC